CVRCWLEKNLRFETKAAIIATEENRRLRGAFPARLHLCFSEMIVKRPPVKKERRYFQMADYSDSSTYSTASGKDLPYVVLQVTLKEKFFGTGSGNLTDLENAINAQVAKGYRLHTISTTNGGSKGFGGGDRIQATLVFEKIGLCR
ncbi:MAG: hypothetical protein LUD54_04970, partial [Oscillospiraceae bacterium]|nr:hypothetical protein [Oscillospiraceae bacterium]